DGFFKIKRSLKTGDYRIRAYTNWMRNFDHEFFFSKDFKIINSSDNDNTIKNNSKETTNQFFFDFLPEGGDLIAGIPSKVAVKATNNLGIGIPAIGKILDSNRNEVTTFTCDSLGTGIAFFVPKEDESYFAIIDSKEYPLSPVKKIGVVIRATHNYRSDILTISVISKGVDLSNGTLVGHQRGRFLFSKISEDAENFFIRLQKNELSEGIIHLTFFNNIGVALSERLVFPNIPAFEGDIYLRTSRDRYAKRSKVILSIKNNHDSIHSASITINPRGETDYKEWNESIVSNLLLTSDLRGIIQSPAYYFNGTEEAYKAMDRLMLTQGWCRFSWDDVLYNEPFNSKFLPEDGLTIRGKIVDYLKPKEPRQGNISLSAPELGELSISGETKENGSFAFTGNKFFDSTKVVLNAHGYRGKKRKKDESVSIKLSHQDIPIISNNPKATTGISRKFVQKVDKLNQISLAYNLDPEATMLDELVVTGQSLTVERMNKRTSTYGEPSDRVVVDSLGFSVAGQTVFDLLRRVPGVLVSGARPNQSVLIRGLTSPNGQSEPLYVLDGAPVDNQTIQNIPIQIVEFVDVLKGPKASIYGVRGSGGVVLIYTREGRLPINQEKAKGVLVFMHPGYHKSKEFYSPQYDVPKEEHAVPDLRSTLFWEPEIKFKNENAELKFYTSDQAGIFDIRIEGLKKNGTPFYKKTSFTVK
ncbi:MAG: TonB-dependent receptor plug domain-containing protein, partial [Bacteroidota bacterium]